MSDPIPPPRKPGRKPWVSALLLVVSLICIGFGFAGMFDLWYDRTVSIVTMFGCGAGMMVVCVMDRRR